jgi:hypothetical protein
MREDTQAALAEDTRLPHRAVETLVVVTHSPRRHAETSAETSIAGMRMEAVAPITADEGITAPALDSVSAFTRLTDMGMPLRFAIPRDSMMQTACGNTIRVAPFRTDIKVPYGY